MLWRSPETIVKPVTASRRSFYVGPTGKLFRQSWSCRPARGCSGLAPRLGLGARRWPATRQAAV